MRILRRIWATAPGAARHRRHSLLARLAVALILVHALLPDWGMAELGRGTNGVPWGVPICTTQEPGMAGSSAGDGETTDKAGSWHCPFCVVQGTLALSPPNGPWIAGLSRVEPSAFASVAEALPRRSSYFPSGARAPPPRGRVAPIHV